MLKGLFVLGSNDYAKIYGPSELEAIHQRVEIYTEPQTANSVQGNPALLHDAEVIFSGWGGPVMDEVFLEAAPNLKAVFYGAGSVRKLVTDAFWERDILITSAAAANAVPVVEYTLSQILFCLKHGWHYALEIKRSGQWKKDAPGPGAYGSTVGLISLGLIGKRVAEMLRLFDVQVIAYDPFVSLDEAAQLNVRMVDLDAVFAQADVVSLHTPWLDETVGMITGAHFASMKAGASFINTSRGAIIREDEMIAVLQDRPDIQAVLDVTWPEPPDADSPLYTLPNVVLTPHIAGSMGAECWRMGRMMVNELERYLRSEPLHHAITQAEFARMA
jgi:phosphoglycerate dehydrogenase-like enzyme